MTLFNLEEVFLYLWEPLHGTWALVLRGLALGIGIVASCHVVLTKRDSRSALGWVGVIWLSPLVGSILYLCFGINRIKRKAKLLRRKLQPVPLFHSKLIITPEKLIEHCSGSEDLLPFAKLGASLTGQPLLLANEIVSLEGGDAAYPAMLKAIEGAKESITLSTYIFDNDQVGRKFVDALKRSQDKGIEVRVLIDDFGARYSFPSIVRRLRKEKIPVARFLGTLWPTAFPSLNLRKHRKTLVVDGRIGFTGGMNIRVGHQLSLNPKNPIQDLHFLLKGPVVTQLQQVFAEDWAFTTGERLSSKFWPQEDKREGVAVARVVSEGPDEDRDKLVLMILGALASAQRVVDIVTPYFLPDAAIAAALDVAAGRGVRVRIILPEKNNLGFVQWASTAYFRPLLERGCEIWVTPPPFDHTKLMVVDGSWTFFGSANWDPRSFRLNFELNVECYDATLSKEMHELANRKVKAAKPVTLEALAKKNLFLRIRDGFARLFSPYL